MMAWPMRAGLRLNQQNFSINQADGPVGGNAQALAGAIGVQHFATHALQNSSSPVSHHGVVLNLLSPIPVCPGNPGGLTRFILRGSVDAAL